MGRTDRVGDTTPTQRGTAAPLVDAFWRAAAALSGSDRYPDLQTPAVAAAETLLRLAALDAEDELRAILRPDLDRDEVTWTVACFEIGCVAPAGVHQVGTASDGLTSLVSCQEPSHVASELICSGPEGMQWVAVVRADRRFTFQFPDLGNVAAPDPSVATLAVTRWRRHVSYREACLFVDELPGEALPDVVIELPEADVRPPTPDSPPAPEPPSTTKRSAPWLQPTKPPPPAPPPSQPEPSHRSTEPVRAESRVDHTPPAAAGSQAATSKADAQARRALRKTVAQAEPTTLPQALGHAGEHVTNQTLSAAMRHAVAEVVPFLEKYLLDAVARAVGDVAPSGGAATGATDTALADLIQGLPQQVASELRPALRRRSPGVDADEVAATVLEGLRDEVTETIREADRAQRERVRRLTERRFDRLDESLEKVERRLDNPAFPRAPHSPWPQGDPDALGEHVRATTELTQQVSGQVAEVQHLVGRVHQDHAAVTAQLGAVHRVLAETSHFEGLESLLDELTAQVRQSGEVTSVARRLGAWQAETARASDVQALTHHVAAVETQVARADDVGALGRDVAELRSRVDEVTQLLQEIKAGLFG